MTSLRAASSLELLPSDDDARELYDRFENWLHVDTLRRSSGRVTFSRQLHRWLRLLPLAYYLLVFGGAAALYLKGARGDDVIAFVAFGLLHIPGQIAGALTIALFFGDQHVVLDAQGLRWGRRRFPLEQLQRFERRGYFKAWPDRVVTCVLDPQPFSVLRLRLQGGLSAYLVEGGLQELLGRLKGSLAVADPAPVPWAGSDQLVDLRFHWSLSDTGTHELVCAPRGVPSVARIASEAAVGLTLAGGVVVLAQQLWLLPLAVAAAVLPAALVVRLLQRRVLRFATRVRWQRGGTTLEVDGQTVACADVTALELCERAGRISLELHAQGRTFPLAVSMRLDPVRQLRETFLRFIEGTSDKT